MTGFATVPSTISSIPTTTAATGVSTITLATIKTVVETVDVARNAAFCSAVTSITANTPPSPSAVSSIVPARLLAHVTRLYLEQARKGGVFLRCPANTAHLLQGMVGIAVVGGGLTYLNRKVKRMMDKVPADENRQGWKEKLNFVHNFLKRAIADNDEIRRDIVTAHDDLMRAQKAQHELLEHELAEAMQKEKELEEKVDASESSGNALAFDLQNAKFDNEALQEQLKRNQADYEELYKQFRQSKSENSELAEKLRLYMRGELQEHPEEMMEGSEDTQRQLDNAQKEHGKSLARLEEVTSEVQTLREQNYQLTQASQEDASALSGKLENERKRIDGLEQSLAQKEKDLVQRNEVLREAQSSVSDLQKLLRERDELLQDAHDNGMAQDEIIEELEEDIREAKADISQVQKRFNEKEKDLQRVDLESMTRQQHFAEREQDLKQQLSQKNEELWQARKDVDDLQQRLNKQEQDLQKVNAHAHDLQQRLDKKDKDLEDSQENELDLLAKIQQAREMENAYLENYAINEKEQQEEVDGFTQEREKAREQLRDETQMRQVMERKLKEEISKREAAEEELRGLKVQEPCPSSKRSQWSDRLKDAAVPYLDEEPPISFGGRKLDENISSSNPSSTVRTTNFHGACTITSRDTSPREGNERSRYKTSPSIAVLHSVETSVTPSPRAGETPSKKRIRSQEPDEEEKARPIKRQSTASMSSNSDKSREVETGRAGSAPVKSEHKPKLDAFKNIPDFAPSRLSVPTSLPVESPSPTRRSARNAGNFQSLNEHALAQRSISPSKEQQPSALHASARRRLLSTKLPKPAASRQTRSQSPEKREGPKSPKRR